MTRSGPALAWLAVTLLAVASVLPSAGATLWPDTIRDLSQSLALARGESFPLAGPSINFGPSLGPVWIWLQAVPLFFGASIAATSLFVAVLASLKFYFLHALGRTLSGDLLGLSFAAAASLPSIAAFQWLVFFHPNLVEAAIAAALFLAALSVARRSIRFAYFAAAVLGLAVQFHPTALFYYPVVVLVLVRVCDSRALLAAHLAGTGLMIVAWFAPVLIAPGVDQQAGVEGGIGRIAGAMRSFQAGDVVTVLRTAFVDVPLALGDTYPARAGVPSWVWFAGVGFATLVCVAGLIASKRRALVLVMAACLLAGWAGATAVRAYTSFYLCYFLLPLTAVLLGTGLASAAASPHRVARLAGRAALVASIACFAIVTLGARLAGRDAWIDSRFPNLGDLKHPASDKVKATLVNANARDRLARFICRRDGPVVLYGEWAYALAASINVDFRLHCPARAGSVSILGSPAGALALTGVSKWEAQKLGRQPLETFGGVATFEVKAGINPPQGRAIESQWYYFEQLRDRQPLARTSRVFRTGPNEAVMLLRLKPFDSRWRLLAVERDSVAAAPVLSTYNRDVFVSGPSGSEWKIEFETDAPQWVDIHVF